MYKIIKAMNNQENNNFLLMIENNKGENFLTNGIYKWEVTQSRLNKCKEINISDKKIIEPSFEVIEKFKQYFNQDIEKFNIESVDIYTRGDLKGYAGGFISFINEPDTSHEFLYRFDDKDNGENFKLVSIDYGYRNSLVAEVWHDIEKHLFNLITNKLN